MLTKVVGLLVGFIYETLVNKQLLAELLTLSFS